MPWWPNPVRNGGGSGNVPLVAVYGQIMVICHIMSLISVRVEKSGRVLIPASVRRQLGLKEGESDLLLNVDETPIGVTTRAQALKRMQEWAREIDPNRLISEELMEERRREAAEEFGSGA